MTSSPKIGLETRTRFLAAPRRLPVRCQIPFAACGCGRGARCRFLPGHGLVAYLILLLVLVRLGAAVGRAAEADPSVQPRPASATDAAPLPPVAALAEPFARNPLPDALRQVRGVHPRLYLDPARLTALRQAIQSTHSNLWADLVRLADTYAQQEPPEYRAGEGTDDEQLWQREVGNVLPVLALADVLSEDARYLAAAERWALASCNYATWGCGRNDGLDLAASHQLFGLALLYDWCYDQLEPSVRQRIRDTLVRRGSAMFQAVAAEQVWWHRAYLQNHLWVNVSALTAAGVALFDEADEAAAWIGLGLEKIQKSLAALGPDGASHEGVGYWEYGTEYLLKFMHLARQRLGVNLFDHEWWRATASYALYMMVPRGAWTRQNGLVDLADCPRGHWYGPEHILWTLAAEYRNAHAQWLAQEIDRLRVGAPGGVWMSLLWYDPSVPALSPHTLPTLQRFRDMDLVSARSGWSGQEALVVMKCGPFLGHKAVQEFAYDPGGGHVHPDANQFVLYGAGEWLIRSGGYRAKWTGYQNTLLVDGVGQLGEGSQWFRGLEPLEAKARPAITRVFSTRTLDHIVGDATAAYPARLGLQRFQRHLLFLKPDVLIVVDDIAMDEVRDLELRFHPESNQFKRADAALLITGKTSVLRVEPLSTPAAMLEPDTLPAEDRRGGAAAGLFTLRLRRQAAVWRTATAFSWAAVDQAPRKVTWQAQEHLWRFQAGTNTCELDWSTGRANLVRKAPETDPSLRRQLWSEIKDALAKERAL